MMTTISNVGAAQVLVASHQLAENASKRRATERHEATAKGGAQPAGAAAETSAAVAPSAADSEQMKPRLDGGREMATPQRGPDEGAVGAAGTGVDDAEHPLAARLRLTEGVTLETRAADDEKRTRVLQRAASGYAVSRAALR